MFEWGGSQTGDRSSTLAENGCNTGACNQELVSKLKRNNNHHCVDLVKDISGLFKNQRGPSNYTLLADIFGLARETTASKHASQLRSDPGLSMDSTDLAAETLKGLPINIASDGARCLRYLEPRKLKDK